MRVIVAEQQLQNLRTFGLRKCIPSKQLTSNNLRGVTPTLRPWNSFSNGKCSVLTVYAPMQGALEHRLPKPLRYFRVLVRFAFN